MILAPPTTPLPVDRAGEIVYPVDNGEPLSNDTEHLQWIMFVKDGLDDWFADRTDVFIAADLLWYPVKGRPDISKAPDVMLVLDHPAGHRMSYQQWEENDRPPQVVFEFLSTSKTAQEMMDKLEFYSDMGCAEFYIYDYQRRIFSSFRRPRPADALAKAEPDAPGEWTSPLLGMTFGLDPDGRLYVRRPDGKLFESRSQLLKRAQDAAQRAQQEKQRADRLAAKMRELAIDLEQA